jgi:hypothetical protein
MTKRNNDAASESRFIAQKTRDGAEHLAWLGMTLLLKVEVG